MFEILTDGYAPSNKRCCRYVALLVSGFPSRWEFAKCGEPATKRFIYKAMVPDPNKKGRNAMKMFEKKIYRCDQHYPESVTLT